MTLNTNTNNNNLNLLSRNRGLLFNVRYSCYSNFEKKFYKSEVLPLIEVLDYFLRTKNGVGGIKYSFEFLIRKLERWKCLYGVVKEVYYLVRETRDLLQRYGLLMNPINPKSLFFLAAREVKKHPESELELYKADLLLRKKYNFSFNNFGRKLLTELGDYHLYVKKREENFFSKVKEFAREIDNENQLEEKVSITKKFWKYTKSLNQSNYCKMEVINKFLKEFLEKYGTV